MRKAEEIFDLNMPQDKADLIKYPVVKKWILNAIKQAQEEAIHETVKRCAENITIKVTKTLNTNYKYDVTNICLDEDSILKIEQEMIKEL